MEETNNTKTIVGVRFRTAGKVYYFDPNGIALKKGDHVIVETARGIEYGLVICDPMELPEEKFTKQLKPVLRAATEEDAQHEAANRAREKEAYRTCQEKIRTHELEMKLIDAEYTFDNSKLLFYFTADGRVDFRELVKDLATVFRTRIELRQVGVRDETKILGGYGICGRPLCCHTYLSDFAPVSIKMAKEQNLSLNPTKISGVCGRLMCCLKNEEETYEELNKKLPRPGDEVEGSDGLRGEVENVDVLRQRIRILVEVDDEKEMHEYGPGEWTMIRKRRRGSQKHKGRGKDGAEAGGENAKELEKLAGEERTPDENKSDESGSKERRSGRRQNRSRRREREGRGEGEEQRDEHGERGERGGREERGERRGRREREGRGERNERSEREERSDS